MEETKKSKDLEINLKWSKRFGQPIRVVEIRFTPSPDADARLSSAIDILLRAAARGEEGTMPEEREAPRGIR